MSTGASSGSPTTATLGRRSREAWWFAATLLGLAAPLVLIAAFRSRLYVVLDTPTYLVIHNVGELFAVTTSFAIFAVAWFTQDQTRDRQALFLGCVFLGIGLLDLMHTLGYAGMPAFFTPNSAGKSTQLWIAARTFSAAGFLASAFVDPASRARWLSRQVLLPAVAALAAVVFTLVTFFPGALPATFVPGVGLTPFKRGAEYVTVVLFALAAVAYARRAARTGDALLVPYVLAFALCAMSEVLFAGYQSVYDTWNLVGHGYKVLAFALVFRAGFVASVQRPYGEVIAKELAVRREVAERRRTEGKFLAFAEAADLVFWITRREPEAVLYVNPAFERIWGRPAADVYRDPSAFRTAIHPDDRKAAVDAFARWVGGPADAPYDVEYRIVRPDGAIRWIADRGFTLEREGGEVQLVAGIAEDVTESRTAEHQLRQSQKLEAVGRLAGGVAHDFNNLLTVILGGCDVLMNAPAEDYGQAEELKEIDAAAHRAADLTRQLLAFSRRQVLQPKVLEVDEIVRGMLAMLRRLIGEDVELFVSLGATQGNVRVDPGQLEQVIVNLAVNARDAMPGGGRLTVETATAVLGPGGGGFWHEAELATGRYVTLTIVDDGCGMSDDVKAHLFEPFFTTKEVGKGTGLGLSTVYGIVKQAGGGLRVRSAPGEGSRFEVFLPRVDDVAEPAIAPRPARSRGTETVLLVEDDAAIRRMIAEALVSAGFSVLEAPNGVEALRLAVDVRRIDLLLTDVVMPAMGGIELAERLRRERPFLRVLFVTGYTDHRMDQVLADLRTGLLLKPFTPGVLLQRIREMLDRPTPLSQQLAEPGAGRLGRAGPLPRA
jgi:PAS domain S-box-containing protein